MVQQAQRAAGSSSAAAKRLGVDWTPGTPPPPPPSQTSLMLTWALQALLKWRLWSTSWLALKRQQSDEQRGYGASARLLARRLVTVHDAYHAHKLFGALSLMNIAHKLWQFAVRGAAQPHDVWLCAHAGLALTSLGFSVSVQGDNISAPPARRKQAAPAPWAAPRWPACAHVPSPPAAAGHGYITREVRLHAVIFSFRALAVILAAGRGASRLGPASTMLLCMPFHLAADEATRTCGTEGWSSIRGHRLQPMQPADVALRRLLSSLQFINNCAVRQPPARRAKEGLRAGGGAVTRRVRGGCVA